MFDNICDALIRELDEMDEKMADGAPVSEKDVSIIDTMAHALKCLATYEAMTNYPKHRPSDRRDYWNRR